MNIETLQQLIDAGTEVKWLHFWGHTPAASGEVTQACLSQWWAAHPFHVDGVQYRTAEHWMMAEKARLFTDEEMRQRILQTESAAEAKKLGRLARNFEEAQWTAARWEIVVQGNRAKFQQHPALAAFLIRTGDRVLVEASPFDRIWGIGMGKNHPDAATPARWKGLNLLGFALMQVREEWKAKKNE